jgi:hypothetical protein
MNYQKQMFKKNTGLVGGICGSLLIGICGMPLAGVAQMRPIPTRVNQPPSVPAENTQPLPEQQQYPAANIAPVNGQIAIKLMNKSNAPVTYQVIGDTRPRTLPGKSEQTLISLDAPVTVTFERPDGGLLQIQPVVTSESGVLEVALNETSNLDIDKNSLRIEKTGMVFLN